jgi:hypothetical protein
LTEKYKTLEANYSILWESTKATPKETLDSSASTSKGCSICSNIDINALKTNHARLEEKIKSKDKEIARLNMLITQVNIGAKSIPKVVDKHGLGHYKNNKANGRVVVKGYEIPLWNNGGYPNTTMDIAHEVTTCITPDFHRKRKSLYHRDSPWISGYLVQNVSQIITQSHTSHHIRVKVHYLVHVHYGVHQYKPLG